MALSLKTAAHSEIGLVRNNNQDSAYLSGTMIVVADGMGGAAAGDLASSVAIRELQQADTVNHPDTGSGRLTGESMLESLSGALSKANDSLADLVAWDHSLEGMGTTVCGAMFDGSQYGICHIGDSRGYMVRDGEFSRLTHDHSWVQSLVDDGKISPAEAAEHPHRSLLLKVLNGQPTHTPDFTLVDAKPGDRLLFCSDGLCGMVEDDVIERALTNGDDLPAIVEELTAAAHRGGGLDNITIIVADVVEHDPTLDAAAPQVLGAAATVEIPKVAGLQEIDLGDGAEETHRIDVGKPPTAPAPISRGTGQPPEGVIDPDEFESIRYSPHLPSRTRRLLPLLSSILAVIVLVVAGYFGGNAYLTSRFFLGPDEDLVAIYQGVPDTVFGQQPFARHIETGQVPIQDLPTYYASQLNNGELRNYDTLDIARAELEKLDELAERCRAEREASATPSPSVTPTQTGPSGTASRTEESAASAESDGPEPTSSQTSSSRATASDSASTSASARTPDRTTAPSATGTSASPRTTVSPRPDQDPCG